MCMHFISAICKQEFKTGKCVGQFSSIVSLWELIQTNECCHFMTMYIVDVIKQKNKLLKRTIPNKLGLNGHTFPYFRPFLRFRVLSVQWRSYVYRSTLSFGKWICLGMDDVLKCDSLAKKTTKYMLYVPKVNCMYLRYRDAWNTSIYSHKLNSKSSEYCLCGPIALAFIGLWHCTGFNSLSYANYCTNIIITTKIRPSEERWGPAEICQNLSVPIVSHSSQARLVINELNCYSQ